MSARYFEVAVIKEQQIFVDLVYCLCFLESDNQAGNEYGSKTTANSKTRRSTPQNSIDSSTVLDMSFSTSLIFANKMTYLKNKAY
jgi:hypothetical protein